MLNNKINNETRELNNNKNNFKVLFLFLIISFSFLYLFTDLWQVCSLISPEELFRNKLGINFPSIFDNDGNLDSNLNLAFSKSSFYTPDRERLIFFSLFTISVLVTYFLPVKYKKYGFIPFSILIISLIYSTTTLLGLISAHLLFYLVLHNKSEKLTFLSFLLGLITFVAFQNIFFSSIDKLVYLFLFSILSGITFMISYKYLILHLLEINKIAKIIRASVAQSAIIIVSIGGLIQGFYDIEWKLPLGILLFFWQWERVIMYHIDYKDGMIPEKISFSEYLTIFLCPAVISNWNWGAAISQGYSYTSNSFLAKEKNILILQGLKLWSIALIYLIFGYGITFYSTEFLSNLFNNPIYSNIYSLNEEFVKNGGSEFTPFTILGTTFISQVRWFMLFGGVVHFKVGAWNLFGYDTKSYFDKPWLATNIVSFWARYTSHYRDFLVKAFYYPFFLRFFKKSPNVRTFMSIMFSVTLGNMVWGHLPEVMFYNGLNFYNFGNLLGEFPYFLLLGLFISSTQIYLLKRKRKRKPWTKDKKFILDILCSYATFQIYSLIHIFARPVENGVFSDYVKIFLITFGIHI